MKTRYLYKSSLAEHLQAYITEMQTAGFKFKKQERTLERFDEFLFSQGFSCASLSKDMVTQFCNGISYEKDCTRYKKEVLLSGFGWFLHKQGIAAYICPKDHAPKKRAVFEPYIFSKEELARIFTEIDRYPSHPNSNRHLIDPILFRLLYGTGLRISEALNLRLKDVDLADATIRILHAKNDKDRVVPIADSLNTRLGHFFDTYHALSDDNTYVFKSIKGGRLDLSTIYRRFREYLWNAGISHSGNGPRIHDIRHTFSVHCLKKWVLSGKELSNLQPYLAAFLGHTDFRGTEYYLRLTADLFPHVISKTEAYLGCLIPMQGGEKDEI